MNVANLSFSGAWGGLEMSTIKIARLFKEAGHNSFLICQPDTPICKAGLELNLNVKQATAKNYFSPSTTLAIRRWIKQEEISTVFIHSTRDIWLVTPALWGMPHIKLFSFARMFIKNISKKDPLHTLMYSRLNAMIALSHVQAAYLQNCLPIAKDNFIVIPNGVDIERFQPRPRRDDIRRLWGIQSEHILFGLIGRLDRQKGSLEFIEAASEVIQKHPHARFVLVGGNTLGEGEFDQLILSKLKDLNLKNHVVLTDFRGDIPDVMNALDVFVMPSFEENFGNVLLESLASGLPTMGTNSGGTPEILQDAGFLFEPCSSKSLADGMCQLIENPELCPELSQKARAKAVATYDIKKVFAQIELLIKDDPNHFLCKHHLHEY